VSYDPRVDPFVVEGHENLSVNCIARLRGGDRGKIKEAIEEDGTLIVAVNLRFVVHHAAQEPITDETLVGLIERQGICATNVSDYTIKEANND